MTKVIFFGSSEYSNIILKKLLTLKDFSVSLVVTKTDKPLGRDQTITPNPVAKFAADHHLPLLQIEAFSPDIKSQIKKYAANLGLCVAFGPPFFDEEMINLFPHKIVNIHPSPLPKYRGATPGPWQIINGETTSAVTFFQIDSLPDHGPIISQISFNIVSTETSVSFYNKAFSLAADNLESTLNSYLQHPRSLTSQDHSQKSYFPKFTKNTAKIDWGWSEEKIFRFINAMNPWPISWTLVANQQGAKLKMQIFSAKFDKKLILETVQLEGKTKINWSEISAYYRIIK
jgi:methionyl-tRNA formyltransferase